MNRWTRTSLFTMYKNTLDDRNPAVPIIRNRPYFPQFRVFKVMLRIYIINSSYLTQTQIGTLIDPFKIYHQQYQRTRRPKSLHLEGLGLACRCRSGASSKQIDRV